MSTLTLAEAARAIGKSKSTVSRAVKTGRLSASRADDGDYLIDQAELAQVFPPGSTRTGAGKRRNRGGETVQILTERLAARDAVIAAKDAIIAEVREQRDKWQAQAERLALLPPHRPELLGWLLRRRGAFTSDGQEHSVRSWPVPLVLKRSISSFTRSLSAVSRRTSWPARRAPSIFGTYKPTRAQRVSISALRVAHVAAAGRVLRTNGRLEHEA